MTYFHGYRRDLEDVPHLLATSKPRNWNQLYSASYDKPLDAKVRDRLKAQLVIESQGRTNSCAGHAASTIMEFNFFLETGDLPQLSRWAAYIWAQQASGISGDSGAHIDAAAKALSSKGLCLEALWKFTGQYHTAPPGGSAALAKCLEDAGTRKLRSWQVLKTYADCVQWLQTGQGGILMGIPWYSNWYNGVRDVMPRPSGSPGGYHAYPLLWTTERKEGSRYYLEGPNSWGREWGNKGFAEWSPSLLDSLLPRSVFVGFSDLDGSAVKPREFDWKGNSPWHIRR